tara:strand:+ start:1542 stop:1760 length:219 start_codon:yes stop_codon:yes gene_type:complete
MSKKPVNVEVPLRRDEPIERALRRFTKKVKKSGILDKVRERMYYEKPTDKRRRLAKRRKAVLQKLKRKQETT